MVGGGWGGVCKVIFMSNPTVVLRLGWGFDNINISVISKKTKHEPGKDSVELVTVLSKLVIKYEIRKCQAVTHETKLTSESR